MNRKLYIVLVCSAVFIALNCFAITKEIFLVPYLSGAAILLYLLIYRVDLLLYLMALATPFSIIFKNDNINLGLSIPTEIIMISISLLFLFRILYDIRYDSRVLKHPISICIILYLLWMLITSITSEIPVVSFKYLTSKLWFIISSYFAVILLIKKDIRKAITFIDCYAVGLAIVVLIVTTKYVLRGCPTHGMHWIMSPFYNDHTAYGAVLAFFLCLMIGFFFLPENKKWKKIFYLSIISILFVGFYLSYSRAAWLSLLGACFALVVIKLRIKFSWLIVGCVILVSGFYYFSNDILYKMGRNTQDSSGNFVEQIKSISNISTDASNVERLNRWVSAFGMIKERPITGWGPGTYQFLYAPYQKGKYKTIISTNFGNGGNAHSEFIGPCAESGFIGMGTVILMMIFILYFGITTYNRTKNKTIQILSLSASLALLSYYIHGILNNFLDTDKLSLPFWSAISIIVVLNIYIRNHEETTTTSHLTHQKSLS